MKQKKNKVLIFGILLFVLSAVKIGDSLTDLQSNSQNTKTRKKTSTVKKNEKEAKKNIQKNSHLKIPIHFILKKKNIILIFCIFLFVFSAVELGIFFRDLYNNSKNAKTLRKTVIEKKEENKDEKNDTQIDFAKLTSINADTIGWIQFNKNKINNPVVHTIDNDYYLKRSFEKEANQAGTIFMDYRNQSFDDRNVVLFGHSMPDDTMFGSLRDIFKKNFFDTKENHYIQIYNTENELLLYQIFSYYTIEKEEYYITTSFASDLDFQTFIDTILKRSVKDFQIEVSLYDKILTLSTCHGTSGTSKRKVVHAKRVQIP